MRTLYYYLKAIYSIIRLQRNNDRTDLVFALADSLHKLGKFQELEKLVNSNPEALKIIEEKRLLKKFSLQELAQLPAGTFGQVYGHHMISQNLNPDFFPYPKTLNLESYVMLRIRQTHDLWHVATGFDTSPLGEIGLQSFMLAQLASPVGMLIVGSSIIRCAIKQQERLFSIMDAVTRGWKMGHAARPLFAYEWEAAWRKELSTVREELNITV